MKENREDDSEQGFGYQITGWILFILCAFFFIASGLKNRDILTFIGSVIFLFACMFFLIPMVGSTIKKKNDKSDK